MHEQAEHAQAGDRQQCMQTLHAEEGSEDEFEPGAAECRSLRGCTPTQAASAKPSPRVQSLLAPDPRELCARLCPGSAPDERRMVLCGHDAPAVEPAMHALPPPARAAQIHVNASRNARDREPARGPDRSDRRTGPAVATPAPRRPSNWSPRTTPNSAPSPAIARTVPRQPGLRRRTGTRREIRTRKPSGCRRPCCMQLGKKS